jgi:hypothetical protein
MKQLFHQQKERGLSIANDEPCLFFVCYYFLPVRVYVAKMPVQFGLRGEGFNV